MPTESFIYCNRALKARLKDDIGTDGQLLHLQHKLQEDVAYEETIVDTIEK